VSVLTPTGLGLADAVFGDSSSTWTKRSTFWWSGAQGANGKWRYQAFCHRLGPNGQLFSEVELGEPMESGGEHGGAERGSAVWVRLRCG
jgi:hypothetical protein